MVVVVVVSCTIFEIEPAISRKSPILTHPTSIWCPVMGDSGQILQNFWYQKTEVYGLSCGVVCEITHLAILIEHRLVTDRRRDIAYTTLA